MIRPTCRAALAGAFASAAACVAGGPGRAQTPYLVLRVADGRSLDFPSVQALLHMDRALRVSTDNALRLRIFPDGLLGDETEIVGQARRGAVDVARIGLSLLTEAAPALRAFEAPYLFRSRDHLRAVIDGEIGQEALMALPDSGLVGLTFLDAGARSIYNRVRPVRRPEDLRGLRLAAPPSKVAQETLRAFGADVAPLPLTQILPALSAGLVHGAENAWPSYVPTGHYETARRLTLTEHVRTPDVLVISRRAWEALGPDFQTELRAAAASARRFVRKPWDHWTQISRNEAVASGVEIVTPDHEAFARRAADVRARLSADPATGDLMRRIAAAG